PEGPPATGAVRLPVRAGRSGAVGDSRAAARLTFRALRRKDLDSISGLLDPAGRILQDSSADLFLGSAGGQARPVHQRRQARDGDGGAARACPRTPAGAAVL